MHALIPLAILVFAVPYCIWEHIKWKRLVAAKHAKRLRREVERHAEEQRLAA